MRYSLLISPIAALILTSAGHTSVQGDSSDIRTLQDARRVAVVYGESIVLSDSLVAKVDSELTLLRNSGFEQFVNLPFFLPWVAGEIVITVDEPDQNAFVSGTLPEWRELADQYGLDVKKVESSYVWHNYTRYLTISSPIPFNSYLLAQKFVGMPTVRSVKTLPPYEGLASWYELWVRVWSDNEAHYFFKSNLCPEVHFRYDYFVIKADSIWREGTHWECTQMDDSDSSMTIGERYRKLDAFIDSAETNRPVWVDTARIEMHKIMKFANFSQFRWERR
ncbi:hypothetical protein C3F09_03215 [candidate division GN15 bacterium]|uniref:Uncharacterized protein n=1 Tax=candidate division GN15 bacterium TaxID=2072418 RepID=A0A855XAI8_9BACT|nr:MAG: hypothetical protein C3F09_03215 [candidate division GN15 bacterium]